MATLEILSDQQLKQVNHFILIRSKLMISFVVPRARVRNCGKCQWLDRDKNFVYRYLVISEFLSKEEVDTLVQRSKQLLEEFTLDGHPLVGFCNTKSPLQILIEWLDQIYDRR